MGVLTKDEILKAIEEKRIEIEPYFPQFVGPGSPCAVGWRDAGGLPAWV